MGSASAIGLGRLSVHSALGEGLRAEIDVTSLSAEEAASLQTRIASPDTYRAAGVEYSPALPSAKLSLQKRADGRSILQIHSHRAVQEPFVDLILELSWSGGRLMREYTLLFDPPSGQPAAPAAPAPLAAPVIAQTPAPAAQPVPVVMAALPPVAQQPSSGPRAEKAPASKSRLQRQETVLVRRGDTLNGIAAQVQPSGVSLDQMVVSLYRANSHAFIGGNMKRLKAGTLLSVPSAEQSGAIPAGEARQLIQVQSADFDAYRERVAATTASATLEPGHQSSGRLGAAVEGRKQLDAETPDRLTRSKEALKASRGAAASPEDGIAKQREEQETSARVAELSHNLEELKRLTAPAGSESSPAPVEKASGALGLAVPAAGLQAVPKPVIAAAAALHAAPASAGLAAPQQAEELPEMLASLLDQPMLVPLAGGLVLMLGGLGGYRLLRARRNAATGRDLKTESQLPSDSFFGRAGGRQVDTTSVAAVPAPNYSPSQLEAIGDVDPVAEADVYLAYGRDLQAEEILKEGLRVEPQRLAIRTKMLEVYAKRRDMQGFETQARQLYAVTGGEGEDWRRACELGRGIDPDNAFYQSAAVSAGGPEARTAAVAGIGSAASGLTVTAPKATSSSEPDSQGPDLDLDLSQFSESGLDLDLSQFPESGLDLDLSQFPEPEPSLQEAWAPEAALPEAEAGPAAAVLPELAAASFDRDDLSFDLPQELPGQEPVAGAPASSPTPASEASMGFDFSGLTLDFDPPTPAPAPKPVTGMASFEVPGSQPGEFDAPNEMDLLEGEEEGDPLVRKFDLADQFVQIGDYEGARELLQEVVSQAEGALKVKAQGLLSEIA